MPWVWTTLEHPAIVVCFEHQHLTVGQTMDDLVVELTEIGSDSTGKGIGVNTIPNRLRGVVWQLKRCNLNVAQKKWVSGFDVGVSEFPPTPTVNGTSRAGRCVQRSPWCCFQYLRQRQDMIAVIVGEKYIGETLDPITNRFESDANAV